MSLTPVTLETEGGSAPPTPSVRARLFRALREFCAIVFWVYGFLKVFVGDVDVYIVSHTFRQMLWVLDYKFFFFVGFVAIIVAFLNKWSGIWFVSYIIIYPLIIMFWRIPYFMLEQKSWFLLFHMINVIVGFVRTFRHRVIASAIFLIAFVTCVVAQNKVAIVVSTTILCLILFYTLVRILIGSMRPQPLFGFYKTCFSYLGKGIFNEKDYEPIRGVPVETMTEAQLDKYKNYLGLSVFANRILLFTGKKLRDYQRSAVGAVGTVIVFFSMWLFTVVCFATINAAIYRMDPSAFNAQGEPDAFTWFRYAFYNFVYVGIPSVTPVNQLSQGVAMLETICALLLLGVFLSVLAVTRGQVYSAQLDDLIRDAEKQSYNTEIVIRTEFGLPSVDAAIAELERVKYGLMAFLLKMTENLD